MGYAPMIERACKPLTRPDGIRVESAPDVNDDRDVIVTVTSRDGVAWAKARRLATQAMRRHYAATDPMRGQGIDVDTDEDEYEVAASSLNRREETLARVRFYVVLP